MEERSVFIPGANVENPLPVHGAGNAPTATGRLIWNWLISEWVTAVRATYGMEQASAAAQNTEVEITLWINSTCNRGCRTNACVKFHLADLPADVDESRGPAAIGKSHCMP
jgi:hypothetical protein